MNAIQQYFSLMQPDSYFFIGSIRSEEKQYYQAKDIVNMDFTGKTNIFFTPNSLGYRYDKEIKKSYINREWKHLDKLCCLYVDIDLKEAEDEYSTVDGVMYYARRHIIGSEVPEPTMVNCSGNGIHMYWVINPVSYKGNLEKWKAMQEYIYSLFVRFGADYKVSVDNVRLLRVPGTINKKDSGTTQAYNISFSGITYDLEELLQQYDVQYKKVVKFEPKKEENRKLKAASGRNSRPYFIFSGLYRKRARDLETLLLKHRDYAGSGRENILFLYRYYQCHVYQDERKALELTQELNSKLQNPLSREEVTNATVSGQKYYNGTQLNWTNAKLIEFLNITDTEMGDMCTLISHAEKTKRKKTRNKKYYEDKLQEQGKLSKKDVIILRQQRIHALMLQGKERAEICRLLNISRATYFKDVKVIKTEAWILNFKDMQIEGVGKLEELEKTGTDGAQSVTTMPEKPMKTAQSTFLSLRNYDTVCTSPTLLPRTERFCRGKP